MAEKRDVWEDELPHDQQQEGEVRGGHREEAVKGAVLDGVHMRLSHNQGKNYPTEAHGACGMLREQVPAKILCEFQQEAFKFAAS